MPKSIYPIEIIEPVTRVWSMPRISNGIDQWDEQEFETIEAARRNGRELSCLSGTRVVRIFGADGALLCSYDREDNIWTDLCRGELTVAESDQSCTCGGTPTVALDKPLQREQSMGWFWACDRCGAWKWSHVDPPGAEHYAERYPLRKGRLLS